MIRWLRSIEEHEFALSRLTGILHSQLDPAITALEYCYVEVQGKVLTCGNGGSAGDASHLATELLVRYVADRKALPAIALSADSSVLTAAGNDYGFHRTFSRQIEALGDAGDVLVAFSTSGKSKNVLEAIARAKFQGMRTIGISGAQGLGCDVDIQVPSSETARIQELTLLIIHLIVEGLEERLPK